ncbi:hypothetical protein CEXT_576501 [Caerostris extrusa]|uniref:Ycf15 n=1 Tax=Caerostris extrusa TaxID=172846 RepID=A0AAV4Q456_CAEEX|nr:hypothetical protein CEXT_576501 [Caerostris extrusa]
MLKWDRIPEQLKSIALATIESRFSESETLLLFTGHGWIIYPTEEEEYKVGIQSNFSRRKKVCFSKSFTLQLQPVFMEPDRIYMIPEYSFYSI